MALTELKSNSHLTKPLNGTRSLHAKQCRALAAQTRSLESKQALEAMAREWESIASQREARLLEEIDRRTEVDSSA
jgi:hypothetical protein